MGHPCSFSVKNIYCQDADELLCEESLIDICTNISTLSIGDNNSVTENLDDENSFTCSTPISSKNSNQNFHKKRKKKIVNAENKVAAETQQFSITHVQTKVVIKCPKKTVETSYQDKFTLQNLGGLKKQIKEMKSLIDSICNRGEFAMKTLVKRVMQLCVLINGRLKKKSFFYTST